MIPLLVLILTCVLRNHALVNPKKRVLRGRDEIIGLVEMVGLLGGTVDGDDALVAAGERVTDADLGLGVGAELLDDVAAAADDAANLADGAEVAEDGVVGGDEGGGGVISCGVAALVFGAGVGIGVRVGAFAVGDALTGHRREWGLCVCREF